MLVAQALSKLRINHSKDPFDLELGGHARPNVEGSNVVTVLVHSNRHDCRQRWALATRQRGGRTGYEEDEQFERIISPTFVLSPDRPVESNPNALRTSN